jgi:type IV pilus biogenesis protein PilP
MHKIKLALNLSKTSIQLLKKSSKKSWNVLGSVDPSSKNLEKDLKSLRKQAAALSTKKPIVDILLPRELVLSQTIVFENDFSIEHCKKETAKRCGINENELLIAIGDSSTRSTVPIAAISTNSIAESRNFVKRAGFRPERYLASSKISGFKKSPVFFNDNSSKRLVDFEDKTFTKFLAATSFLLFAGFLISLTSTFLEHSFNNRPYNYLADPKNFIEEKKHFKSALSLLSQAKKVLPYQIDTSTFQQSDKSLAFSPQKPNYESLKLDPMNKLSIESQFAANLKTQKIMELNVRETMIPVSVTKNWKKFNDVKEFNYSKKIDSVGTFENSPKKTYGMLPRVDDVFLNSINKQKSLSKKSETVSNSLEGKKFFETPKMEKIKNHEYKRIVIEEILSDISSTKILITTANNRASTLPLLHFGIDKPNILTLDKFVGLNSNKSENMTFISPTGNMREELPIRPTVASYGNKLTLNHQLNVKLKDKGLNIKLLDDNKEKYPTLLSLWNGPAPIIKPNIIDSIKVLEDPTKSTGAVTFVELPPKMPSAVSKLKKVMASSIRNLNVRSNPPSIPKRASIAGNSTLKNLIELNRTNLIGIFGKRTGKIALIRLSSGNTVKVKVGQQFGNGWRVISIDLDKIHITNGSRQETLRIPG